ncbi:MAG: cation:proton antiporter [Candidatus Micrarchaeota archaeon]
MVAVEQLPIIEIGVVILTALLSGILFSRLGQSSAIGYIAAGLVLGPLGFNMLAGEGVGVASLLGEIGVTMLLFYLGLELSMRKFQETGAVATVLAFVEMLFAFVAGFLIARFFGFSQIEAMVIGAMLTATSTVITGKFLIERGLINTPEARVTISVLILEDFFAILVLVFIAMLSQQQTVNLPVLNALFFVIAMFFVVSKVSKHVLNILNSIGREDQMWLYSMGIFLVVSYFGSEYLGLSPAIGAYFAGFALAESAYGEKIKRELGLFREFFVLFFFVSFGATTTFPSDPMLYWLVAALAAGYVLAKLVAHGITGTAIGMELKSAVTGGILMSPLGEFAIIIAIAAKGILPHASDVLSVAFLLTISTTIALPILYGGRERIAAVFERFFPIRLQEQSRILQREMNAVDRMARDVAAQNEFVRSLGRLFTQLVIAVSIVYLSYLTQAEFSIPFLEFLPAGLSPGLVILPLVVWPLYKFIAELKHLTRQAARGLVFNSFRPSNEVVEGIELDAADVFTGIVLTLFGVGSTAFVFYAFPGEYMFVLIPATYTLLSLMYLSKSFYGLIEQYEAMETQMGIEGEKIPDKRVVELAKEFNEHAKYFRQLNLERLKAHEDVSDALRSEDLQSAKHSLISFKKRETKALVNLFDFKGLAGFPRLKKLVGEGLERNKEFHGGVHEAKTRAAFQKYLSQHLKPHLFEARPSSPEAGSSLDAAAQTLIERELAKSRQKPGKAAGKLRKRN